MSSLLVGFRTVAETAETDISTILRWVRDGDMPAPMLVGGLPRWNPDVLYAWRSEQCPKCDPPTRSEFHRIRVCWLDDTPTETQRPATVGM